jgi:peptide/nickel transport system permease protein
MLNFFVRRFLVICLLLFAVTFATFLLMELAPGDPLDRYRANPQISNELINNIEEKYGLDEPILIQYLNWLKSLAQGDMGHSFTRDRAVAPLVLDRFYNTVGLMVTSVLVTWLLALPMGIYCAVNQFSWGDQILSVFAFLGMSIPNFFLCFLLLYLASLTGSWPLSGMTSINYSELSAWGKLLDYGKHLLIPVVVISTAAMARLQRITRGNLLEVLRKQYVTMARARGLPENRVIYVHALRNAINPLITLFGFQFTTLISGAALVEIIVSWPGLGSLMLKAVRAQDQFLVVGVVLMSGVLLIVGNLIADVLLTIADPRISFREANS